MNIQPGDTRTRSAAPEPVSRKGLSRVLPKGLYTRSLLIVILPMLLLQSVVALIFMERHWQRSTEHLSQALAQDIAALIELNKDMETPEERARLIRIADEELDINLEFLPAGPLPEQKPVPRFFIIEPILSAELERRTDRDFRIDARTERRTVEILVALEDEIMRATTHRNRAYASNSHIFLVWMVSASILLIIISILFLRNQIKPILQLATAAENLGMGRPVEDFRPRGAQEVRKATQAFFAMRDRIERQIEQRTTMLAGVSHDLRTVLTRLRLQIALLPKDAETADMESDVGEMERMLEGYLAFARGDAGEEPTPLDAAALLREVAANAGRAGTSELKVSFAGEPLVTARPDALRRALTNLVVNAARFGGKVTIEGEHTDGQLTVTVDDDGPGISEDMYEEVFRPFLRLDEARNLDHPGSGLGLTIARDIARGHGGDVELSKSPLGGLRARLHIPA